MNKILLAILDGVGLREEIKGNAFKMAYHPNFDYLWDKYPHTTLSASGIDVGLPEKQMGNSETGHLNIGAGRIVYQPLELINKSIKDKTFFSNKEFIKLIKYSKENNKKLHLLGLISDGGVHSHINHIKALLELCKSYNISPYMHLITDGRDTLMNSGRKFVKEIESMNIGIISTICGRYYTMDRDKNYDRIEAGYNLITKGIGTKYNDIESLFNDNYNKKIYDEFIPPSILDETGLIEEDDAVIWFNFRPDRAVQILTYLQKITKNIVTMLPVSENIKLSNAFNLQILNNTLGEYLANNNIKQLRIAETEKYAHVTYFFDGGIEKDLKGCTKILIPSPKVSTYDLKPEMSAEEVTEKLLKEMENVQVVILNYANCDMVGHTGSLNAAIKAVKIVDKCLGKIYEKCTELGFTLVVTADHGNCELMIDENDNVITSHTTNKVPFIVCKDNIALNSGKLSDIAPTLLKLMNIKIPNEMTGTSLYD